jgi:hypothetical protein
MSNSLVNTVEVTRSPQDGGIEMLQFALPIPADHREKVRALTYLHETVDFYIKDFCDPKGRPLNPLDGEDDAPRVSPHSVTFPQAVQIFLTFSILLVI